MKTLTCPWGWVVCFNHGAGKRGHYDHVERLILTFFSLVWPVGLIYLLHMALIDRRDKLSALRTFVDWVCGDHPKKEKYLTHTFLLWLNALIDDDNTLSSWLIQKPIWIPHSGWKQVELGSNFLFPATAPLHYTLLTLGRAWACSLQLGWSKVWIS